MSTAQCLFCLRSRVCKKKHFDRDVWEVGASAASYDPSLARPATAVVPNPQVVQRWPLQSVDSGGPGAGVMLSAAGSHGAGAFSLRAPLMPCLGSRPVPPPPRVAFPLHAPAASVTVPPGAFRFFFGWIPLEDDAGYTYWWNTLTNETTYRYPRQPADVGLHR